MKATLDSRSKDVGLGKSAYNPWPTRTELSTPVFYVDGHSYTLSIARTRAERAEAYGLVFDVYQSKGFTEADALPLWYSIHNALPETVTFVVKNEIGTPVASGTVVPDSPFGLPMERMYADEINNLRRASRRVFEINSLVSCAASEGLSTRKIILKVFSAAFWYARDVLGAEDLLCVTSPEHARFYRRALLLDEIGPLRGDPHANDVPSIALRLDTQAAEPAFQRKYGFEAGPRNLYRFFCPSQAYIEQLEAWMRQQIEPISERDLHYFFVETTDILRELSPNQRSFLQTLFPDFRFWDSNFFPCLAPAENYAAAL